MVWERLSAYFYKRSETYYPSQSIITILNSDIIASNSASVDADDLGVADNLG